MTVSNRTANCVNDLDLENWQQYEALLTDSLWLLDSRDSSGVHQADYHGNFIPQIPNQLLHRFTRAGDVVIDPFLGSGTTAIEADRLGRRCIGVELSAPVAALAWRRVQEDRRLRPNHNGVDNPAPAILTNARDVIVGDSSSKEVAKHIGQRLAVGRSTTAQFMIMHPPYHDIIHFSDHPDDLSNCESAGDFIERFISVYDNLSEFLEPGRHLAIVIGDIYANSEWIPLQNLVTARLMAKGDLTLKGIIVKNMVNNRAKRNQERLWRYRALANGFYVFKHEYIVLFRKNVKLTGASHGRTARQRRATEVQGW